MVSGQSKVRAIVSEVQAWRRKLDALSRLQIEEGMPDAGVNVTLRLAHGDRTAEVLMAQVGFKVFSQVDNIVTGHVDSESDLGKLARLSCVEEVQLARPLFTDEADSNGEDLA
jgi:hypothetical protein